MFDSRKTFTARLADATDLMIDFATLGEYGLEPVRSAPRPCEGRRRDGLRSNGSWAAAVERFATQV
ncbi:MAG TPA: hypothetical protein VFP23_01640 [Solirubrobacterales bacterium]|nr:hypothetical protein [Solirubrobacterales bacterium]